MASNAVDVVVAEANLKFLAPARFDEEIDVSITVQRLGNTGMDVSSLISRDQTSLVTAELRYVFVDLEKWEKTPIPEPIREKMEIFGADD